MHCHSLSPQYASTLLSRAPTYASKSFVSRFSEGLSENKLLSAFMHYEQRRKSNALNPGASSAMFVDDPNASIRYLEGVIKLGSKSRAVYNCKFASSLCYVIFLYFS
jgi:hypothetical protein